MTVTAAPSPRHADPAPKIRDWGNIALWAAVWSVTVVSTWMAASGQVGTWRWANLDPTDLRRFGLPFLAELGVIAWLLLGRYAYRHGQSPWPWWAAAGVFAVLAVYMNTVHGTDRQALIFGTASALSLALWFAKFVLDYLGYEVDARRRAGARPKVLFTVAALFDPRVRWRAFLIAGRYQRVRTVEQALELADLWIWVRQDTRAHRTGRGRGRVARRTAWQTIARELGIKVIQPKGVEVAAVEFAPPPAPVARPPRAARLPEPPVERWAREQATTTIAAAAPVSPAPTGAARRGSGKQDPRETYADVIAWLNDPQRVQARREARRTAIPTAAEIRAAGAEVRDKELAQGTALKILATYQGEAAAS